MAKKKDDDESGIKARVLIAVTIGETEYKANDVAVVSDAELDANSGVLDAHPAAVEYAESLK